MKPETHPVGGFIYYSYVLTYVDDILVMHHDAMTPFNQINHFFKMNPESMGNPDIYLGVKLRKCTMNNGVECWYLLASKYVQEAVRNVKNQWSTAYPGIKWPRHADTPFMKYYLPELEISEDFNTEEANYYQSLICIVRWMIELGRIDMITDVSILYSFLSIPRQGRLEAVFQIFAYLDNKHNARIVFDPTYPEVAHVNFRVCWIKHNPGIMFIVQI